jgi:hypothetical protein
MDTNKETISRLKFISKIQIGEKINLKYMYIQNDGLITQLTRTIFQDNRTKTLTFLQDTINKAFEILKCYQKSKKKSDKIMCSNLVEDLSGCKTGLKNLKETYISDIKFCCDIDTLTQMIEAKLIEINILPPPPSILDSEEGDDL